MERPQRSEPPDDDDIDVAAARGIEQLLPEFPHGSARTDFFDLDGNGPAAPRDVVAHGPALHRQGLLVMR